MVAADRIPCVVLGCKRTASRAKYPEPNIVIICGKCWRTSSKNTRRRIRRVERVMRRLRVTGWADSQPGTPGRHAVMLHNKLFEQIVVEATEAKVGIG